MPEPNEWQGRFVFECPTCRERGNVSESQRLVTLDTDDAGTAQVAANHSLWTGLRCKVCGDSFTVESTLEPSAENI